MVSQLGDNINNFFGASGRGELQWANDNGVPLESIALSVEPENFDATTIRLATQNSFTSWGIDALSDRTLPRESFSTFSGFPASTIPGRLAFADRRRVVVVDATDIDNLRVRHNDLPLSSGAFSTAQITQIRDAINSAEPLPPGTDYATWVSTELAGSDLTGFEEDADRDGWLNGLEFAAGTNPLDSSSIPLQELIQTENGFVYRYQIATDRIGIQQQILAGPLDALEAYAPSEEDIERESLSDDLEQITVTLPEGVGTFVRQQVEEE